MGRAHGASSPEQPGAVGSAGHRAVVTLSGIKACLAPDLSGAGLDPGTQAWTRRVLQFSV